MILQSSAEAAETNIETDERRDPECVETIFGFPNTTTPFADPKGKLVGEKEAIQVAADAAQPGCECNYPYVSMLVSKIHVSRTFGILVWSETISALCDGRL